MIILQEREGVSIKSILYIIILIVQSKDVDHIMYLYKSDLILYPIKTKSGGKKMNYYNFIDLYVIKILFLTVERKTVATKGDTDKLYL